MKTETVGLGYIQTTTVFKLMTVGVAYVENVGVHMQTTVGMTQNLIVGQTRDVKIGKDQKTKVGNDRDTSVAKNDTLIVGETLKVKAKRIEIAADEEILLTCGASTIKITKGQIEILSPLDKLNC